MILYEYPLNERIRTYLRLERLFQRQQELVAADSPIAHHYALTTLFEVVDVSARADLKTEVLKDLDRHKQQLLAYRGHPHIAEAALEQLIAELEEVFAQLSACVGRVGQALSENEWLMSVRSRSAIPGGTCEFDLPSYYAWQCRSADLRRADLDKWSQHFLLLFRAIGVLLRILRESGTVQKVMATAGQFHQALSPGRAFQLLRLSLDAALGLVPEISANRLVVSVRLMQDDLEGRMRASAGDTAFELALCS